MADHTFSIRKQCGVASGGYLRESSDMAKPYVVLVFHLDGSNEYLSTQAGKPRRFSSYNAALTSAISVYGKPSPIIK